MNAGSASATNSGAAKAARTTTTAICTVNRQTTLPWVAAMPTITTASCTTMDTPTNMTGLWEITITTVGLQVNAIPSVKMDATDLIPQTAMIAVITPT
jgi:hypothetical protein